MNDSIGDLIREARRAGVEVCLGDGRLRIRGPGRAAGIIDRLKARAAEVAAFLKGEGDISAGERVTPLQGVTAVTPVRPQGADISAGKGVTAVTGGPKTPQQPQLFADSGKIRVLEGASAAEGGRGTGAVTAVTACNAVTRLPEDICTPTFTCPSCGADDLHPDDVARFGDCPQCGAKLDPAGAAAVPPPAPDLPLNRILAELEAAGGRVPELFRCHRCGSVCRLEPGRWKGVLALYCPGCRRPAGTIKAGDAAHFAALKLMQAGAGRSGLGGDTDAAAPDRCPTCGAELSAEDVEKCRKTLPGWEDAPHPAGVVAAAEGGSPDPTALDRAMAKIRSELGSLVA